MEIPSTKHNYACTCTINLQYIVLSTNDLNVRYYLSLTLISKALNNEMKTLFFQRENEAELFNNMGLYAAYLG